MHVVAIVFLVMWLLAGFSSWWRIHHTALKWDTEQGYEEKGYTKSVAIFLLSPLVLVICLITGLFSIIYIHFFIDDSTYDDMVWWYNTQPGGIIGYTIITPMYRIVHYLKYHPLRVKKKLSNLNTKEDW